MVYPRICIVVHALRPAHEPVLQVPNGLPYYNDYPRHSQQHVPILYWLGGSRYHVFPPYRLVVRTSGREHRSSAGYTLQSNWGHGFNFFHGMDGSLC